MTKLLCRCCSDEVAPITIDVNVGDTKKIGVKGYRCARCGLSSACECSDFTKFDVCKHILLSTTVCPSECD